MDIKKTLKVILFVLAIHASFLIPITHCSYEERSKEEQQRLLSESDLVFEGTATNVVMPKKPVTINAIEDHPDLGFVVTFKIKNILKGEFLNNAFTIAVHSPTLSFKIRPWEYAKGNNNLYRVYIKLSPTGRRMIASEILLKK